jgi:hypothetical protein
MLVQSLVRAVVIEVALVLVEDSAGVSFVVDQHFVGALFSDRSDEPFGVAVSPWCLRWGLDHLEALGGEDSVEGGGEFGIPVADQERNARMRSPRSINRLRAAWVVQAAVG